MWKVTSTSVWRYVAKLDSQGIEGYRRVSDSVANPSWEEVKKYIEQIDGHRCTEMSLDGPKRYGMVVGGGPDRFCVSTIGEDMGPYDLLGPDPSDEPATIILGGVATDLPRRFQATREQALQAAEYFYHHGQIDPTLNWERC